MQIHIDTTTNIIKNFEIILKMAKRDKQAQQEYNRLYYQRKKASILNHKKEYKKYLQNRMKML